MTAGTEATGPRSGSAPRVVVGVDGSSSSMAALEWAAAYAEAVGGHLRLVAVWDWPTSYGWSVPIPDDFDPAADAQRLLAECEEAVRGRHPRLSLDGAVAEGHPAPVLVAASADADLLVVGSRGHGQFAGMLIGSVSEHCVAHAQCPVLVYRGPEPAEGG